MAKILKGRFGKPCADCDGIIPAARLRLQPKARLCVECQGYAEARIKRSVSLAMKVAKARDTIIVRG